MGTGIVLCGLNGAGKSTLGKALADKLRFHFIDNEDLYFPKTDSRYLYAAPRTREEAGRLLLDEIGTHEHFVFACVRGDYGEAVQPFFRCAVLLEVPKEIRMERIRNRSYRKFGSRMLSGGDLYEREERFFAQAASRAEDMAAVWAESLRCPVLRVDGTKPAADNVLLIAKEAGPIFREDRVCF